MTRGLNHERKIISIPLVIHVSARCRDKYVKFIGLVRKLFIHSMWFESS